MSKAQKINDLLDKRIADHIPIQVWPAEVKAVEEHTCTVDIVGTDLVDVPGVLLVADEDATDGVFLKPRVGSYVLVGLVKNSIGELYVASFSEVDEVRLVIGDVKCLLDEQEITLQLDDITLKLAGGKLSVASGGISLKGLFDDLTSLLGDFKVLCGPAGSPSTAVFPATLAKVQQLKTQANQLLSG